MAGIAGAHFDSGALNVPLTVYDDESAPGAEFAQVLGRSGVPALPTKGDAIALWFTQLRELEPTCILGLTTDVNLFCLSQLTQERGLRIVFYRDLPAVASASESTAWVTRIAGELSTLLQRPSLQPIGTDLGPVMRPSRKLVAWAMALRGQARRSISQQLIG